MVVAELAAVAMRWSPIASLVAALGSPTMASVAEELERTGSPSKCRQRTSRLASSRRGTRPEGTSAEFFEAFRYHQAALLGLLREQRERARRAADIPDEQLQATLRREFLRAAHTFTPDEWAMLDRVRAEQPQDTSDTDE